MSERECVCVVLRERLRRRMFVSVVYACICVCVCSCTAYRMCQRYPIFCVQVLVALCEVVDHRQTEKSFSTPDELVGLVTQFATAADVLLPLLDTLIRREVESTGGCCSPLFSPLLSSPLLSSHCVRAVDESTLFRRNSMATKIMGAYSKAVGRSYLTGTLAAPMRAALATPLASVEMDANRLAQAQREEHDLVANAKALIEVTEAFLSAILASAAECPRGIRAICRVLHHVVGAKFPASQLSSVGGFVFLRFLCPAIISPEQVGLGDRADARSPDARRVLVLASKVLQNIANGITSSGKEDFMEAMNKYVSSAAGRLSAFFEQLVAVPADAAPESPFSRSQHQAAALALGTHLKRNVHAVGRELTGGRTQRHSSLPKSLEKRGWLYKKGEKTLKAADALAWRKRWCVLRNHQLCYFKSQSDASPMGVIPLADHTLEVTSRDEFLFLLHTPYRTYDMRAGTPRELAEWTSAFATSQSIFELQAEISDDGGGGGAGGGGVLSDAEDDDRSMWVQSARAPSDNKRSGAALLGIHNRGGGTEDEEDARTGGAGAGAGGPHFYVVFAPLIIAVVAAGDIGPDRDPQAAPARPQVLRRIYHLRGRVEGTATTTADAARQTTARRRAAAQDFPWGLSPSPCARRAVAERIVGRVARRHRPPPTPKGSGLTTPAASTESLDGRQRSRTAPATVP